MAQVVKYELVQTEENAPLSGLQNSVRNLVILKIRNIIIKYIILSKSSLIYIDKILAKFSENFLYYSSSYFDKISSKFLIRTEIINKMQVICSRKVV